MRSLKKYRSMQHFFHTDAYVLPFVHIHLFELISNMQ